MNNCPLHTEFQVIHNVVASDSEAGLELLFHNVQTTIPLLTTLKDIGHQQPLTPKETDNSTALGIVNSTDKQNNPKQ